MRRAIALLALLTCHCAALPASAPPRPAPTTAAPAPLDTLRAHPLFDEAVAERATHIVTAALTERRISRQVGRGTQHLRLLEAQIHDQLRGHIPRASFLMTLAGDPSLRYPHPLHDDRHYVVLLRPQGPSLEHLRERSAPTSWQRTMGRREVLAVYDLDASEDEIAAQRDASARFERLLAQRCDAACFQALRQRDRVAAEAMMGALMHLRRELLGQFAQRGDVTAYLGQPDHSGPRSIAYDLNHAARAHPRAGRVLARIHFTFDARGRLSGYREELLHYDGGAFVPMPYKVARRANLTWYAIEGLERR